MKDSTRLRDAQRNYGQRNGHPGLIVPTYPGWNSAALAVVANRAYYGRFVPDDDILAKIVTFNVSTAGAAGDQIDLGFYNADGTAIWRRGAEAGWLSGAVGPKNVPISQLIFKAGVAYYFGWVANAAGASVSGTNSTGVTNLFGLEQGTRDQTFKDSAFPLPDPMAAVAGAGGGIAAVPILALKE